jgi:O-antigen/teichoic acid export membrane protein
MINTNFILSKEKKQVLLLYGSSIIGVALGILNSVINTRALLPSEYGDYRYIQNIIDFVTSLLLFGYFTSGSRLLALSKTEQQSRDIRGAMCLILSIAIGILMFVMFMLGLLNVLPARANLFFLAVPVCGYSLMLNYINTVGQGDNHIGRISMARIVPPGLYCLIACLVYRMYGASSSKMLLLYDGIGIVVYSLLILSTKPNFSNLKYSLKRLFEENKKYGFNVYLGSLIAVSTQYIAGITLGKFCLDNSNVGFYTLSATMSAPLSMLPMIIGTTFFKKFASQRRIDKRVLGYSFILTIGSCILFICLIKYVVAFLYDDNYSSVGIYAAFLAVATSVNGLGDLFNRFLGAHGQGRPIRDGALACGMVTIIGNFLFVYLWGIKGAIVTRIMSSSIYFLFMYLSYRLFTKGSKNEA